MKYDRILIWEPNWIGDVLFTTPCIRAIRKSYPKAHIACIAVPSCRELLERNPYVDEVLIYDEKTVNKGIMKKLDLIRALRAKKFDVAVLLHRSLTRAMIAFFSGIPERVGYRYAKRNLLLTVKAPVPPAHGHRIEYFLGLARMIGADGPVNLDFFVTPDDDALIQRFFSENKIMPDDKVIVINPGGNWEPKRWPIEKHIELCRALMKKPHVKVIVSGSRQDVNLFLRIQDAIEVPVLSLSGRMTLGQLGALLKRADLFISADSGPMHVALALNRKTIALFGPTAPALTGPYGSGDYRVLHKDVGCKVPCYRVSCRDRRCMKAIEVYEVVKAAEEMTGI